MLKGDMSADITVVIRSSGERTLEACRAIVAEQVPEENIFVVQEVPFTASIRKAFEIGIDTNRRWTIALDADRLIRRDAIARLTELGEQTTSVTFEIRCWTLDKLFAGFKDGGVHLYRTALLKEAIDCIPDSETKTMRPETYVIRKMAERGYPHVLRSDWALCFHDFEQYYRDIYRKAFVHARKHARFLKYLMPMWQRLAASDFDYQVALWGARAGASFDGMIELDMRTLPQEIAPLLHKLGREEKKEIMPTTWTGESVSRFIDAYEPPPEYEAIHLAMMSPPGRQSTLARMRDVARKVGYSRLLPWLLGNRMQVVGSRLQDWAEKTARTLL